MNNESLVERLKFWRAERPDEWMMDEFIRGAKKLEQEHNELVAQVERLRAEFPLFDDDGLCEHEHHCEFTLLHERKRLHGILSETPPAALTIMCGIEDSVLMDIKRSIDSLDYILEFANPPLNQETGLLYVGEYATFETNTEETYYVVNNKKFQLTNSVSYVRDCLQRMYDSMMNVPS